MRNCSLVERRHETGSGTIAYWVSAEPAPDAPWLVLLPGLTADHRLFDAQLEHFAGAVNVLTWDPPSHGASRPFLLNWSLDDLACWLHDILRTEGANRPVLVGQSMSGYTAQAYLRLFPNAAAGFVSIDSCPLGHEYYAGWELFALKHTKLMHLSIPWGTLKSLGANGCATTETGRGIMRAMMDDFEKREYCELATHGFRVLAEAIGPDRTYPLPCPALLMCGTKDMAGSAKRYNRAWEKRTGLPVHWLEGAGHNSNTDAPEAVNQLISEFLEAVATTDDASNA